MQQSGSSAKAIHLSHQVVQRYWSQQGNLHPFWVAIWFSERQVSDLVILYNSCLLFSLFQFPPCLLPPTSPCLPPPPSISSRLLPTSPLMIPCEWCELFFRQFIAVKKDGTKVTAREMPSIVLVEPSLSTDGSLLNVQAPNQDQLQLEFSKLQGKPSIKTK